MNELQQAQTDSLQEYKERVAKIKAERVKYQTQGAAARREMRAMILQTREQTLSRAPLFKQHADGTTERRG